MDEIAKLIEKDTDLLLIDGIVKLIEQDTDLLLNDIKTFIYLRSELYTNYVDQTYGIGGGNFLMLVGLFSTLFYMAKCYAIIKDRQDLIVNHESLLSRILIKLGIHQLQWGPHRVIDRKALKFLLKDYSDWNLSKKQFNQIMDLYRNSLAHMGLPKLPVSTIDFRKKTPFNNAVETLDKWGKPFDIDHHSKCITSINADLVYRDVLNIRKNICIDVKKLDTNPDIARRLATFLVKI